MMQREMHEMSPQFAAAAAAAAPGSTVEDQVYIILEHGSSLCGRIDVISTHFPDECLSSDAHTASHNRGGQHISGLSTSNSAILKSKNLFINMFCC